MVGYCIGVGFGATIGVVSLVFPNDAAKFCLMLLIALIGAGTNLVWEKSEHKKKRAVGK